MPLDPTENVVLLNMLGALTDTELDRVVAKVRHTTTDDAAAAVANYIRSSTLHLKEGDANDV